jgi:pimeloyl-ACP methyl ester carboxylesterase
MIGVSYDDIAPRNRIADVEVPVLLIHGEDDEVVPIEDAFSLRDHNPDCTLIVVPGGNHSDLDAYEPYFGDVDEFLRSSLMAAQPLNR